MNEQLLKGLTSNEKEEIRGLWRTCKKVRQVLKKEFERLLEQSHKLDEQVAFMSTGENRDKYVAGLGYRRGIRDVLNNLPEDRGNKE